MYLQLPRYFMKKLAKKNLTGKESQILFVVLDKLFGYSKERNRGKTIISASYITTALNLPKSNIRNINRTLEALELQQVLHRTSTGYKRPMMTSLHSSMLDETRVKDNPITRVKVDPQIKIKEKQIIESTPLVVEAKASTPLATDWDIPVNPKEEIVYLEKKWLDAEKQYINICKEKHWGSECEERYLKIAQEYRHKYESYRQKMNVN